MTESSGICLNERPPRDFKKVVCILPAYNAEKILEPTLRSIPQDSVHEFILTDDCSTDRTAEVAERLGVRVIRHDRNRGHGANQKTC